MAAAIKKKAKAGDTLDAYYGEFLVSPIPMELSFNYCSHKCAYCFANLNKPERTADTKATLRLLADYNNRESLVARLLQEGYPVLVSNRVDPFAASNYQVAVPIICQMAEMGIPLAFQTKGGRGIDDALAAVPPSAWYVSISMLDDSLRRRIEPGAPSIDSRFELMERLAKRGHHVTLGLNPLVPEWCHDFKALLDRAQSAGVRGVWAERLHLHYSQVDAMSDRERAAIGQPLIARAKKRRPCEEDASIYAEARCYAQSIGMEIFGIGQPNRSDYFEPYKALYPKLFPTVQDFVNAAYRGEFGNVVDFDQFADFMCARLPAGILPLYSYVGVTVSYIAATCKVPYRMTYRQLLAIIWSDTRMNNCPAHLKCFAFQGEREADEWVGITDSNGLPYLVFDPAGFDEYFTETTEA